MNRANSTLIVVLLALPAVGSLGGCPATDSNTEQSPVLGSVTTGGLDVFIPGTTNGAGATDTGGTTEMVDQTFTIEPDDFDNGTQLTEIGAYVDLYTALDTNEIVELFYVTATDDEQGLAPNGTRVFAHFNIPFFNNVRRLLMDFDTPASSISIQFAGGNPNGAEIGRLVAYNAAGAVLAEYVTAPRGGGEVETMTITRDSAEIALAIAYVADGEGSFGRFDGLTYTVRVAAPAAVRSADK